MKKRFNVRINSIFATILALTSSVSVFTSVSVSALEFGEKPLSPEETQRLNALIQDLGSPSNRVREQAGREILDFGSTAIDALEAAKTSDDFTISELAQYCRHLLTRNVVYSGDSPQVRLLLNAYPTLDSSSRINLLYTLGQCTPGTTIRPLLRILFREEDSYCSYAAALGVIANLPFGARFQQFPQLFPNDKAFPDPVSFEKRREESMRERGALLVQIQEYLKDVQKESPGIQLLKHLVSMELGLKTLPKPNDPSNSSVLQPLVMKYEEILRRLFNEKTSYEALFLYKSYIYSVEEILYSQGETTAAEQFWTKTEEQNFDILQVNSDADALTRLTQIVFRLHQVQYLFNRGSWDLGGKETLRILTSIQPSERAKLLPYYSAILSSTGQFSDALQLYKEVRRFLFLSGDAMEPEQRAAINMMSLMQARMACVNRDYESAKKTLSESMAVKKDIDVDVLILARRIALYTHDDAWLAEIEKYIERDLNQTNRNIQQALQGNRSVLDTSLQTLLNRHAWLAANTGRELKQAEQNAVRALEIQPETPGIMDTLACVYFAQERYEDAFHEQSQAVDLEPFEKLNLVENLEHFRIHLPEKTEDAPTE